MAHVEAWYARHNIQLDDDNIRIIFADKVPDLLSTDDCLSLVADLQACLPANAEPVIFIDTWQRATAGATQNDDKCMQRAIRNAEGIGRRLGAPIVIAAHPPKGNNGTISGSSVIENSSVAIWELSAEKFNVFVKVD